VAAAYLEQSAAHLRSALALRPGSAYTWAGLAIVKLRLEQFDAELDAAITRAWKFGPREPEVQTALTRIALRADGRLAPAGREAARAAMTILCTPATAPLPECPRASGSADKGLSRKRL
jgi:cytochrome c-type biogenesis protein CcmH/NrfG